MRTLLQFASARTSQGGEDGVIVEILRRLGMSHGWFVDVGAHDGVSFSNTYNLLLSGWRGVLIEKDEERVGVMKDRLKQFGDRAHKLCREVSAGPDGLDSHLRQIPDFPETYDLLNIDVDGPDWHIWKHHVGFRPKVVVIEIHGAFKPGVARVHTEELPMSSWTSTMELAEEKGYRLAAYTGNMLFVDGGLFQRLGLPEDELRDPDAMYLLEPIRSLVGAVVQIRLQCDEFFRRVRRHDWRR